MRISVLCSDNEHPVFQKLKGWIVEKNLFHEVELVNRKSELSGGDLLFLISCHEVVNSQERLNYKKTLVIHASALPKGKGWSPHIWQILEGKNEIMISLIEAEDKIDSGAIWKQQVLALEGHELNDEVNDKLFNIELQLMDFAVINFNKVQPKAQQDQTSTYYPKRTPEDSCIDIAKTLEEQFDLLRVVDQERYPAFFDYRGHRYIIKLEKHEK